MRKWSPPEWMQGQLKDGALKRCFARIRNYGSGPRWLKVRWQDSFRIVDQESKDGIFRLKDEESGQEYYLDKEEILYWLRHA